VCEKKATLTGKFGAFKFKFKLKFKIFIAIPITNKVPLQFKRQKGYRGAMSNMTRVRTGNRRGCGKQNNRAVDGSPQISN
jgi:hypothetical protein